VPDAEIGARARAGIRYGWMESVFTESPAAKSYTALSLACPNGHAEAGVPCPAPKVCPERVAAAVDALHAGQLEERPEPTPAEVARAAQPCEACVAAPKTSRGYTGACSPAHQCARQLPAGRCRRAAILPGRWCAGHGGGPAGKRWTDNAVGN
jgi:hypothetical protein